MKSWERCFRNGEEQVHPPCLQKGCERPRETVSGGIGSPASVMVSMDRMWLLWPSGAMLKRGERTEINVQWTKETKTPLELSHGTFGNRFGAWRWREGFAGSHKKDVNCWAPRVLLVSSVKTPSRCLHSEWAYFIKNNECGPVFLKRQSFKHPLPNPCQFSHQYSWYPLKDFKNSLTCWTSK